MAAGGANMIPEQPPAWLEHTLLLFLNVRNRETISGDLLEEYREEQLPRLGSIRANFWYLRQVISIGSIQILGGPLLKQVLILMSLFVLAAGAWLGVMENILKHDGYEGRSIIAVCIAMQGLATLLCVLLNGGAAVRKLVMTGAAAILLLGGSAIVKILRAQHFEGFVLVIGLALILQGVLTLATLLKRTTALRP
jgi:predicted DNA repair protein MutK